MEVNGRPRSFATARFSLTVTLKINEACLFSQIIWKFRRIDNLLFFHANTSKGIEPPMMAIDAELLEST